MNHQALLDRILAAVDRQAYMASASHIDERNRAGMTLVERAITDPGTPADTARALAARLHDEGRIDRVNYLSALHAIAASPKVRDYDLAARLAGEQEMAALELGGAELDANLACVDRHRGVLAFLKGHNEVALDYFTRALERQRNAVNLQNVLCVLLRLGEHAEARDLLAQIRRTFPPMLAAELDDFIDTDPDLATLRTEHEPQ